MTPDQQLEVWAMLDREHLAGVARGGPEPIFATISGAHLYGFASPDSDVDLRGAFLLPARAVLGLHPHGLEVLERGELLVRRPDATELRAIRDGALSFEALLATAARLEEDMQRAAARTALPDDVDRERIDQLAIELMLEARADMDAAEIRNG